MSTATRSSDRRSSSRTPGTLSKLELALGTSNGPAADLLVEILRLDDGQLGTATVLDTIRVPRSQIENAQQPWPNAPIKATEIDLTERRIRVRAGEQLAYRLSSPGTPIQSPQKKYVAYASLTNIYPRGSGVQRYGT